MFTKLTASRGSWSWSFFSVMLCCPFMLLMLPGVLQAIRIPQNSGNNAATATSATSSDNSAKAGSKYEIRGVAGEPNYKSVNLTWEVEFVPAAAHDTDSSYISSTGSATISGSNRVNVTNMSVDVEPPRAFQIFYCEMQNYGPQRCRVKVVNSTASEVSVKNSQAQQLDEEEDTPKTQMQHFSAAVDNLRMATRYSFHIRPAPQRGPQTGSTRSFNGRSDFHNDNEIENGSQHLPGQSIIIPTKGFSAHATQCLPHASEIEVQTGPYFGGRIVVDGGNCGVKGDPSDSADKYTMRIDHKECGSLVKPETNTVETFITVQENLGIFTHSTRRFVVVCSYQSGMQTVRASFTVPRKNGMAAVYETNDPFEPDEDQRLGRELHQMRYVNKNELVLKELDDSHQQLTKTEPQSESLEQAVVVQEIQGPSTEPTIILRGQGRALNLNERHSSVAEEEPTEAHHLEPVLGTRYAKLVVDQTPNSWMPLEAGSIPNDLKGNNVDEGVLRYIGSHLSSVLVTVSLSVIIISICIVLLQRHRIPTTYPNQPTTSHLPPKTLPRALQRQQYQCTL